MNLIVAVSSDWGIGRDNDLLFYIKEDLRRFRTLTIGKVVVMGHGTFKSLPNQQPLKDRKNIVLSRENTLQINGVKVCNSLDSLRETLKSYEKENIFIIGGETIYRQLLNECETAYVTKVDSNPTADVFFPNLDKEAGWLLVEESETKFQGELGYRYCKYKRV